MWLDYAGLVLSFAIILICCEIFTNGIEWLGKKLKVGDGVVGSIFSAVGTCLPETVIPIIAILFSKDTSKTSEIGIGAIIGAPFMLCTLAFSITGLSVLMFERKRRHGTRMNVNSSIFKRDVGFYILTYSMGILASFIKDAHIKWLVGVLLIVLYLYYMLLTVRRDDYGHGKPEKFYFERYLNMRPTLPAVFFQVFIALTGIVFGAELFIENIRSISDSLNMSPLVLSLIITPVATELPEKFNSIIWISKGKDTLALGNITGAMVFQSCIPVSVGLFAKAWRFDVKVLVIAMLAILSGVLNYLWVAVKGKISPFVLITSGIFYAAFICFLGYYGMNR